MTSMKSEVGTAVPKSKQTRVVGIHGMYIPTLASSTVHIGMWPTVFSTMYDPMKFDSWNFYESNLM